MGKRLHNHYITIQEIKRTRKQEKTKEQKNWFENKNPS